MGGPSGTLSERLWRRVQIGAPDECWPWLGYVISKGKGKGYGQIREGVLGSPLLYTHRVAYEDKIGPIPAGLTIDHLCVLRRCCNPAHMETVTLSENGRRGAERRWRRVVE